MVFLLWRSSSMCFLPTLDWKTPYPPRLTRLKILEHLYLFCERDLLLELGYLCPTILCNRLRLENWWVSLWEVNIYSRMFKWCSWICNVNIAIQVHTGKFFLLRESPDHNWLWKSLINRRPNSWIYTWSSSFVVNRAVFKSSVHNIWSRWHVYPGRAYRTGISELACLETEWTQNGTRRFTRLRGG